MKVILVGGVRFYRRFISPLKPATCRFYPTCSCYAEQALTQHGAVVGSFLAVRRILKCHPFHPGGVDLVPANPRVVRLKTTEKHVLEDR